MKNKEITLEVLAQKLDSMDKRFDGVDRKFAGIDKRFDSIDKKFDSIDKKFDNIDKKFDSIDNRFDSIDNKFITVGQRFDIIGQRIDICNGKLVGLERGQRDLSLKLHLACADIEKIKNLYDSLNDKLESSMVVSANLLNNLDIRLNKIEIKYESVLEDKGKAQYKKK